jgi:hypothetical protein
MKQEYDVYRPRMLIEDFADTTGRKHSRKLKPGQFTLRSRTSRHPAQSLAVSDMRSTVINESEGPEPIETLQNGTHVYSTAPRPRKTPAKPLIITAAACLLIGTAIGGFLISNSTHAQSTPANAVRGSTWSNIEQATLQDLTKSDTKQSPARNNSATGSSVPQSPSNMSAAQTTKKGATVPKTVTPTDTTGTTPPVSTEQPVTDPSDTAPAKTDMAPTDQGTTDTTPVDTETGNDSSLAPDSQSDQTASP